MKRIYINQTEEGWEWGLSNGAAPAQWFQLLTKGLRPILSNATDRALARHARRIANRSGVGKLLPVSISRIGHGGTRIVSSRELPKGHLD